MPFNTKDVQKASYRFSALKICKWITLSGMFSVEVFQQSAQIIPTILCRSQVNIYQFIQWSECEVQIWEGLFSEISWGCIDGCMPVCMLANGILCGLKTEFVNF